MPRVRTTARISPKTLTELSQRLLVSPHETPRPSHGGSTEDTITVSPAALEVARSLLRPGTKLVIVDQTTIMIVNETPAR